MLLFFAFLKLQIAAIVKITKNNSKLMVISSLLARQSKTKADLAWLDCPTRPGLAWSDSVSDSDSGLAVSVLPGAGAGPGRAAKKKLLRTTEAVRRAVAWGR